MKSVFKQPVSLLYVGNCIFKLEKDFEYHVGSFPSSDVIVVPAGFPTDLASVPRILWPIFPPHGSYGKAAIIHDYLLKEGKRPRKECDDIFLESMKVDGVSLLERTIVYTFVRVYSIISSMFNY